MKAKDLLSVLDTQDRENALWLFTRADFRVLFPLESENTLKMSLRRHAQSGLLTLVKKGLYANERARSMPADRLTALVPYLKPDSLNYLSRETRLSELGLISQMPLNYLTVMTRGNSRVFKTRWGTVEFAHTKKPVEYLLSHTQCDPETGLLMADAELALQDLKDARRNLDLVEVA